MHTINKLQIELNKLEEIKERQKNGLLSPYKAQQEREKIRSRIFDILETEDFLLGK